MLKSLKSFVAGSQLAAALKPAAQVFSTPIVEPDDLIAAHIIQKLATDFDKFTNNTYGFSSTELSISFTYSCWNVRYGLGKLIEYSDSSKEAEYGDNGRGSYRNVDQRLIYSGGKVNNTPISDKATEAIAKAFRTLRQEFDAAKEIAKKAEAEMKASKAKWDLAENLMGMRRLPTGALVPADQNWIEVDGKWLHDDRHFTKFNKHHEYGCDCDHCSR